VKRRPRSGGILPAAGIDEHLAREAGPPAVLVSAGPESFLQDHVVRAAVAAALGDPDSPEAVVLHGPTRPGETGAADLVSILDDIRTPFLFSAGGRKVIVVRRADLLLAEGGEAWTRYLEAPAPGSLLVLSVDAAPGDRKAPAAVRKALDAAAASDAVLVSCEAPSSDPPRGGGASALGRWVAERARARGKRLDPRDGDGLILRSGTSLATLDKAVAAAALHAGDAPRIAPADLEAVAPRGAAEGTDRFVEALLAGESLEALRVLSGLYREGAWPWGAKSPVRGDTSITFLLVGQVRRVARDVRTALRDGGSGPLPPSLRFGCRDPRRILQRSRLPSVAGLLADLTAFEADLKSGASGGERARFEALVLRYAGAA